MKACITTQCEKNAKEQKMLLLQVNLHEGEPWVKILWNPSSLFLYYLDSISEVWLGRRWFLIAKGPLFHAMRRCLRSWFLTPSPEIHEVTRANIEPILPMIGETKSWLVWIQVSCRKVHHCVQLILGDKDPFPELQLHALTTWSLLVPFWSMWYIWCFNKNCHPGSVLYQKFHEFTRRKLLEAR